MKSRAVSRSRKPATYKKKKLIEPSKSRGEHRQKPGLRRLEGEKDREQLIKERYDAMKFTEGGGETLRKKR